MNMTEFKAVDKLDDIAYRLEGCRALLHALCVNAETMATSENALACICELIDYILQDLQTAVSAAGRKASKG